jgi:hypothetical protein
MAYGLRYQTTMVPIGTSNTVYVDILKNNYSGSVDTFRIAESGAIISISDNDYFAPLVSTSLELRIINNFTDFFELDELFSTSDFEFKIEVYDSTYMYFEGYVPCDIVEQIFLKNGTITLNATNNLKRLNDFQPTVFIKRDSYRLMDIIHNCLSFTGLNLPVYINCTLTESRDTIGQSLYVDKFVYSDLFLDSDQAEEYKKCDEILTMILKSAGCKLCYWNGAWYIDRVKDLGTASKTYFRYEETSSASSSVVDVNAVIPVANNNSSLRFKDSSQTISYIPAVKQVKVTLNEKERFNLVNYYFDNILAISSAGNPNNVYPDLWTWETDADVTYTPIQNYYKMLNSVALKNTRTVYPPNAYLDYIGASNSFGNAQYDALWNSFAGLYTRFKFSLNTIADSTLTIKFKFKLPPEFLAAVTYFTIDCKTHPSDHKFYLRFFLKNKRDGDYFGDGETYWYVSYNETTSKYFLAGLGSLITTTKPINTRAILTKEITFDNFTNKDTYMSELSIDIPLDDFKSDIITNEFVLGICELGYHNPQSTDVIWAGLKDSIFGDIYVTINKDLTDNVVIGTINRGYMAILEEDLDIFDTKNLNMLNGLYRDPDGTDPTINWKDGDGLTVFSLVKKFIEDRFQIYSKVRRQISSNVYYKNAIKPFTMVSESHFANNFYVSSYQWDIAMNFYNNMVLKEWVHINYDSAGEE